MSCSREHVRMNMLEPLLENVLPYLKKRFPGIFLRPRKRQRPLEIQLEFPWTAKR